MSDRGSVHPDLPQLIPRLLDRVSFVPPVGTRLPWIVSATGASVEGNGTSLQGRALTRAAAEHAERAHFATRVRIDESGTLACIADCALRHSLVRALSQTAEPHLVAQLPEAPFTLTRVRNLFDHSVHLYPTILICYGRSDLACRRFLPAADSAGCACHERAGDALSAALVEFIERQNLCVSWLSGRAVKVLSWAHPTDVRAVDPDSYEIFSFLSRHGRIEFIDADLLTLTYTVVAVWIPEDPHAAGITAGSGCGLTPQAALAGALREIWATSVAQSLNKAVASPHSTQEATLESWLGKVARGSTGVLAEYLDGQRWHSDRLRERLKSITKQIFWYHAADAFGGFNVHYVRVVSPDAFIHTKLAGRSNPHNEFMNLAGINCHDPSELPF